jgi:hypothetical protein
MKYPDKDELELLQEFEDMGYCFHICPDCGNETDETEADNNKAYCSVCFEVKNVEPAI